MIIAKRNRRQRDPTDTKALAGLARITYFDRNGEEYYTEYQQLKDFIPIRFADKADEKTTQGFQNLEILQEILQSRESTCPQIPQGAEYVR